MTTSSKCLLGSTIALSALLAGACSSSSTTSSDTSGTGGSSATTTTTGAGGTSGVGGTGDPGLLVGSFVVRAKPPIPGMGGPDTPGSTAVLGKVYDGPNPAAIIWVKGTKDGDCQILTPKVPFCNTPCGGSAVCVADDVCEPYPTAHSAGTVTLSGLKTEAGVVDIVMDPLANNYQPPASVKLAYPAFGEGDTIRFSASGDYFAPFTVEAKGVSPLELPNTTIKLDGAQPLKLAWTAPAKPELSIIRIKLDISHHGGTKGMIECDSADDGSLEISAALVQELLDLGVAGYPSIIVTRKSSGSATIKEGRVDAVISSEIERIVDVPGVVSCIADTDCPDPQTCQSDLTCK